MSGAPKNWTPITKLELETLISSQLNECDAGARALFDQIRIEPKLVRIEKSGYADNVYVVAEIGNKVMFYDDTEDGFEIAAPDSDGILRFAGCGQFRLSHALIQIQTGGR